MRNITFILFIFLLFSSCSTDSIKGSNNTIKKSYDFTDFTKIDASNTFSVKIIQGDEYKVNLSCNENILEFVEITKEGSILNLELTGNHSFTNITLKVSITVPNIESIKASGATKVKIGDFNLEHLSIDLSGASSFKGAVKIENDLKIEASGASTIKMKGSCKSADIEVSGASTLNAKDLIVQEGLIIDASGASTCSITAKGTLEMKSSGASSIDYYGKGKVIKKDESGAGSIEKKYRI